MSSNNDWPEGLPQPAWDTKKHDAKVPHKPDIHQVRCMKCREEGYWVPLHNIQIITQGPTTQLALSKPEAFMCAHCNTVLGAGHMVNNARKSSGIALAPGSEKTTQ